MKKLEALWSALERELSQPEVDNPHAIHVTIADCCDHVALCPHCHTPLYLPAWKLKQGVYRCPEFHCGQRLLVYGDSKRLDVRALPDRVVD